MPSNLGSHNMLNSVINHPTRAQSSLNAYGGAHKSVGRLGKFDKL